MSRCPRASRATSDMRTTSALPRIAKPTADSNSASLPASRGENAAVEATVSSRWAILFMILEWGTNPLRWKSSYGAAHLHPDRREPELRRHGWAGVPAESAAAGSEAGAGGARWRGDLVR